MTVIITRNAIHGGVETIIEMHSRMLGAPVFVAGGHHDPHGTCPFSYARTDTPEELEKALQGADVILYHWLPGWATAVINSSGIPAIEYVHSILTADGDRSVPRLTIAHSQHIVDYIQSIGMPARLVPYPLEAAEYPLAEGGTQIGGLTSYYDIKGLDTIIKARKMMRADDGLLLTFYGSGSEFTRLQSLAAEEGVAIEMLGPAQNPKEAWKKYRLAISASLSEGGAPLAILEALACGIPAIVPKLPGCVEISRKARAKGVDLPLYFFNGKSDDLARVMSSVLQYENNAEQNRAAMKKLFPPGVHITAIQQGIEEVKDRRCAVSQTQEITKFIRRCFFESKHNGFSINHDREE